MKGDTDNLWPLLVRQAEQEIGVRFAGESEFDFLQRAIQGGKRYIPACACARPMAPVGNTCLKCQGIVAAAPVTDLRDAKWLDPECAEAGACQSLKFKADGAPAKLWLWKNFVDGKPEYWAFDHPYPTHMDCGDPQTLGEPCGYAIVKQCCPGRSDWTDESVLREIVGARSGLMNFYGVATLEALVAAQARHIEKLQSKLPPTPSMAPQRVREG